MNWPAFRRRHFVVNRFQNRLLLVFLIHFAAVTFISLAAFLLIVNARLGSTSLSFKEQVEVSELITTMTRQLWPAYIVIFLGLVVQSTLVTHRVAGPLIKIRKTLARIGEGDLTQHVTLRRTDYLREEAALINEMTAMLKRRFITAKDEQAAIEGAIKEMGKAIEGGSIGEIRRTHALMAACVRSLRNEMDKIIIEPVAADWDKPQVNTTSDVRDKINDPV